ncbi:thiamine biosynthesis protein ThiI [Clostridiales bacterium PH28_bin88]|nr:thiamine biosynthesis protein ThiI [Clostridiales bacterium PH28_bin88]
MYDLVLVRYGEIGLKGKNRAAFEDRLVGRIRGALGGLPPREITRTSGRVLVELKGDDSQVLDRLQRVFGIVSISPAVAVPLDLDAIQQAGLKVMEDTLPGTTFKVETRRPNKRFPHPSPEVNREVGGYLLAHLTGITVDVHRPQRVLWIEIREREAYVYSRVVRGPGGLPVGVTGRGVLLISGGIDSPVAGWMAMKRGLEVIGLHFHSFPFTSERSKEKVIDLCRVLARYSGRIILHVAPFTRIQKEIKKNCHEELYVTVMRRMMFRIASRVAEKEKAPALVTGESLGQVASQTLYSMVAINEVVNLPVLRPLVALDKTEIIEMARQVDTFDISIRPYEDCCTLFLPPNPAIRPRLEKVHRTEQALDVDGLVEECLANLETMEIKSEQY